MNKEKIPKVPLNISRPVMITIFDKGSDAFIVYGVASPQAAIANVAMPIANQIHFECFISDKNNVKYV